MVTCLAKSADAFHVRKMVASVRFYQNIYDPYGFLCGGDHMEVLFYILLYLNCYQKLQFSK